ncbi:MAG: PAS domain S-box protein [Desulfobacterales bacterium]
MDSIWAEFLWVATILAAAAAFYEIGRRLRLVERLGRLRQTLQGEKKRIQELEANHGHEAAARRQTEDNLREYLQLLDTLINTIPNPIYFKDAEGVFRGCNQAFARKILGMTRDQIIGRRYEDMPDQIPPDLAAFLQNEENKMAGAAGVHSYETEIPCADGESREFLFNIAPVMDGGGKSAGSVGVMLDLTEKNRAARDRIEKEKFQGVLEIAGGVCHELNQPLQALSGYTELLQMEAGSNSKLTGLTDQILAQVERLAGITAKLQNLTRYQTLNYGNRARIIDIHRSAETEASLRKPE